MAGFFINRPILAWVIAIVIMMVGAASIRTLPVEQYPSVAPVSVQITATYPGASAETVATTVTQVIEQKLSGIDNLLYMSSTSSSAGTATNTLTFQQGTNADIAQVQVQNKVEQASSSLPQTVQNQGVQVAKAANSFLMIVSLSSSDGSVSSIDLGNVIATQIEDPLTQIDGVGDVTLFGAQHAMRVWLDPVKLQAVGLTASDVTTAITNQNVQLSVGQIGGSPSTKTQAINATISASSLLTTPAEFGSILLRVNTDGSKVLLSERGSRRRRLQHGLAAQRQARRVAGGQARKRRERNERREGGAREAGTVDSAVATQRGGRLSVRHHAVRAYLDRRGREDADRGGDAGVRRDVYVPAEPARNADPDHRGTGGAARYVRGDVGGGLLDQRALDVRARARHRLRV
jgi:Cu/Ag efflux pump CusA